MLGQRLFDEGSRHDSSPQRYSEDTFSFYNRAAGTVWQRIRETLDDWFALYPSDHARDLRGRFRSKLEGAHVGAFWELYLYRLFTRMGCAVEVHPEIPGTPNQPDFRLTCADWSVLVEATTVFSGIVDEDADPAREAWILDIVNKVSHPNFFVGLDFISRGTSPPRARTITAPLLEWLDSLDPDAVEVAQGDLPTIEIAAGDWRLAFYAAPIVAEARGSNPPGRLLGYGPPTVGFVDDLAQIKQTLRLKRSRYGRPDVPLVVAMNCTSTFVTNDDMAAALYGSRVQCGGNRLDVFRADDGTWSGPPATRGARMSAVLALTGLHPGTMASVAPVLWHNPWANHPMRVDWPFSYVTASESGEITEHAGSANMSALLGLRPDWPGPEPRFS